MGLYQPYFAQCLHHYRRSYRCEQLPWSGINPTCSCKAGMPAEPEESMPSGRMTDNVTGKEIAAPTYVMTADANPVINSSTIKYRLASPAAVSIRVYDVKGNEVKVLTNQKQEAGTYSVQWNASGAARGVYIINAIINGQLQQSVRITKQ